MNTMYIVCNRMKIVGNAAIGDLYIDGTYFCNTLEDLPREVKIENQTCIPCGEYDVGFREVLSKKTEQYIKRYPWFTWHLEIKDITNFKYVYFHTGNKAEHSSGCVLLGQWLDKKRPFISNSRVCFSKFYLMVSDHLKGGGEVVYTVNDLTEGSE